MKTLTIEQVKQLEAKGVTFDDTLLVHFTAQGEENAQLIAMDSVCYMTYPNEDGQDYTPAPTLQEVLDKLPKILEGEYELTLSHSWINEGYMVNYEIWDNCKDNNPSNENPLTASFDLLNWVVDNGHYKTK